MWMSPLFFSSDASEVASIVVGSILSIFLITFKTTISAPVEFDRYIAWLNALSEDSERSSGTSILLYCGMEEGISLDALVESAGDF